MKDVPVIAFHVGCNTDMSGQPSADRCPSVVYFLSPPMETNGVKNMVPRHCNEQMTVGPRFILLMDGTHPKF
jgi:hypothetical protein